SPSRRSSSPATPCSTSSTRRAARCPAITGGSICRACTCPAWCSRTPASFTCASREECMRLAPIERPSSLLVRIAYWMSRRQLGAVMSPMKVIYARVPRILRTTLSIVRATESLSLDPALKLLVTTQSSLLNGCAFCADLHLAQAVQAKLGRERFRDLLDFASS